MTKKILLLTMALSLFLGGTALAILYSDTQDQNVWFNRNQPVYTWTFDLDDDFLDLGDINAGDTVNSAYLWFRTYDNYDGYLFNEPEFTDIYLGLSLRVDGWEVDPGVWGLGNVTAYVDDDYRLAVRFNRDYGDFGVSWMRVFGDYTDNTIGSDTAAPVPEPATLLLLGGGLIGIAGTSRRRLRKNR